MGYYSGELEFNDVIKNLDRMPKQKQFIASKSFGCAYVGGEGCVSPETLVSGIPIAERNRENVSTLFGHVRPSRPFRKGQADLYEVQTQSGKRVVVTKHHRFLTPNGWDQLSNLSCGSLIAVDDTERAFSDPQISPNFQDYNSKNLRQYDELPRPEELAFQDILQQLHKRACDSIAMVCNLHALSTGYSYARLDQSTFFESLYGLEASEEILHSGYLDNLAEYLSRFLPKGNGSRFRHREGALLAHVLSSTLSTVDSSTFHRFLPFPYIDSFWDEVQDISFVRHGEFYDLTVPLAEHYSAQGIWHHNSAKTSGLMTSCILNAADDPGGMSLVGRLNMPALETTTLQTFLELVPTEWGTWAEAKKIWTFENGHQVLFRHLDITDPKVQGHIKSLNLSKAYVDEASEVDEKVILLLIGRLRRKTKSRRILRLGSNPAGHDYLWRMFFDPGRKADWKRLYEGINASSMENVFLPEEYLANRLATYPADWAERFIYGYFTDFTDLVYKEFTELTHVYDDTTDHQIFGGTNLPPQDWPIIVGMDIGSGSEGDPWALPVIAVAPDGRLYQFAEVYGVDLRISPIAAELHQYLHGRILEGLAYDFAQRAAAQELEEHGINGVPAMKERRPGLFKTEQYMHIDSNLTHPFNSSVKGSPRYFVAASCQNTIREISGYKWPKDRAGQPKNDFTTNHENSHMPDGIRYAIHTFRPLPMEITTPKKWDKPGLPLQSKIYWQQKEVNDQKQAKAERMKRTPFHSTRRSVFSRHV